MFGGPSGIVESTEVVEFGTANGPTDEAALILRAGLAGCALEKALVMDC